MLKLGINIDHVATLRQARGTIYPSVVQAALRAEQSGADSITLHLREDRRHIQDEDVKLLRVVLQTRMNLESAITPAMLDFALSIRPHDVCLVPERRAELTTEGGLDVIRYQADIQQAVTRLQEAGIRVALFIDPEIAQIEATYQTGATVIELHTGCFADANTEAMRAHELARIQHAIAHAHTQGLVVHAGHGLNYFNVQAIASLPHLQELNIGHAIVAHALFVGWDNAVREMKALISGVCWRGHVVS